MSIVTRDYKYEDIGEIIELLYQNGFTHLISPEIYKWQFYGYGNPIIKVAIDTSTNKIVGHYGLMPMPFYFNGKIYSGGKIEGSVVHKDYRGKESLARFPELKNIRIFHLLVNEMEREIKEKGYDFVFGFPNTMSSKTQMGVFQDFSFQWDTFIKAIDYKNVIRNKLTITNTFILNLLSKSLSTVFDRHLSHKSSRLKIEIGTMESIGDIAQLSNELFKKYGYISIQRNEKLIQWKYIENPTKEYVFVQAKNNTGQLEGALIYSIDNISGFRVAEISDIVCDCNNKDVLTSLLTESLRFFNKEKAEVVRFFINKNTKLKNLKTVMRHLGFIRTTEHQANFLYVSQQLSSAANKIFDINNWYITSFFKQT